MVIAQLWAFANDVYTVEQGKRLFAIVGFGASLGAIAGSFVTGHLVEQFGPYPFMLAAAGILGLCMILTNIVNLRERKRAHGRPETPPEGPQTPGARAVGEDLPPVALLGAFLGDRASHGSYPSGTSLGR